MLGKTAHWAGIYVALAAMFFRAFLPDGWMPAAPAQTADSTWIPFVICTSNGAVQLDGTPSASHQDANTDHDNGSGHTSPPCTYAVAATLAEAVSSTAIELHQVGFVLAPHIAAETLLTEQDPFPRQRSRAPPFLTI